jgi:hypothetical protein
MNDSLLSSKKEKEEVESSVATTGKKTTDVDDNTFEKEDRSTIEKAVTFWNHPSLAGVSSEEKCNYLRKQCGLSEKQIHQVWEQMTTTMMMERDNNSTNNNGRMTSQQQQQQQQQQQIAPESYHNHIMNGSPVSSSTVYGQQQQQQQRQYQPSTQPHYYNNNNHTYDEYNDNNDGSISIARGMSLVAVGGFIGVSAAAAIRWLNGGDFELFPSPQHRVENCSSSSNRRLVLQQQQQQQHLQQNEDGEVTTTDDEYYDGVQYGDDDGIIDDGNDYVEEEEEEGDDAYYDTIQQQQQQLLNRIELLSNAIDTNTTTQEKLLLKMSNTSGLTSTITDQSMNLLRRNSNIESDQKTPSRNTRSNTEEDRTDLALAVERLAGIKDDFIRLVERMASHTNGNRQDFEEESNRLLKKFDDCISSLNESTSSRDNNKNNNNNNNNNVENEIDTRTAPVTPIVENKECDTSSSETPINIHSSDTISKTEETTITTAPKSLPVCIRQIAEENDTTTLKVGAQLLYLYLVNLSGKPDNQRYRKIFTSNQSFQKVESLTGGKDLLLAVGFVEDNNKKFLEWVPSGNSDEEITYLVSVKEAAAALGILKSGKPSDDLTEQALSKLSIVDTSSDDQPDNTPSLVVDEDRNIVVDSDNAPETPAGSMLKSPPMMKKFPFPDEPSGIATNLSERLEQSTSEED